MRRSWGIADSTHVRPHLARYRDQLVARLTGDQSSAMEKRSRSDDDNLKLLLAFGLRRDSNCLDVGANEGLFLRDFRRLAPSGHHIAYEPIPHLATDLAREYPEMDIRQRALADQEGERTFVHVLDPKMEGYSGFTDNWVLRDVLREVPTEPITVATERLDDHLPDNWLPQFVKIDVEGAEHLVIEGARRTFSLAKPTIAFEHGWNQYEDRDRSESVHQLICEDLGLRLFDMDGNGPLGLSEFIDGLRTRWNWVAHE
jgi:FkbM family methyltransferase